MSMTYEGGTYEGRRRGPRGTPDIRRCVRMQLLHGTARTRRRSSRSEMAPLALAVLAVVATQAHGLNNGFNKPQLGWNSWNHFGCGELRLCIVGVHAASCASFIFERSM